MLQNNPRLTNGRSSGFPGTFHRSRSAVVATVLLCALALASCAKSPLEDGIGGAASGRKAVVTLRFEASPSQSVEVKGGQEAVSEYFNDIWVVQFNSDGSRQLCPPAYVDGLAGSTMPSVDVPLVLGECRLVVLANTGNPALLSGKGDVTLQDLKKLDYSVTDANSTLPAGAVPRWGEWSGDLPYQGPPPISMKASLARVRLNLSAVLPSASGANHTLTVTRIDVKNVPNKAVYMADPDRAGLFPGNDVGTVELFSTPIQQEVDITSRPLDVTFYVPENLRGRGTGSSAMTKTAQTAPDGQAGRCTRVEIRAVYNSMGGSPGGNDGDHAAEVVYTLFLGENMVDDYNVRAGRDYQLDVVVRGVNVLDARIRVDERTSFGSTDEYCDPGQGWIVLSRNTDGGMAVNSAVDSRSAYLVYIYSKAFGLNIPKAGYNLKQPFEFSFPPQTIFHDLRKQTTPMNYTASSYSGTVDRYIVQFVVGEGLHTFKSTGSSCVTLDESRCIQVTDIPANVGDYIVAYAYELDTKASVEQNPHFDFDSWCSTVSMMSLASMLHYLKTGALLPDETGIIAKVEGVTAAVTLWVTDFLRSDNVTLGQLPSEDANLAPKGVYNIWGSISDLIQAGDGNAIMKTLRSRSQFSMCLYDNGASVNDNGPASISIIPVASYK